MKERKPNTESSKMKNTDAKVPWFYFNCNHGTGCVGANSLAKSCKQDIQYTREMKKKKKQKNQVTTNGS